MTSWPFVSRERLEETKQEVSRLRTENAELRLQLKDTQERFTDLISLRSGGPSIFGKVKDQVESEPESKQAEEITDLPATRARSFAKQVERKNQEAFTREEQEAQAAINLAVQQGKDAAERNASPTTN